MTNLKKEIEWLKEIDKFSLQNTLKDLDTAFKNFFTSLKKSIKTGFPRFKFKKINRFSYRTNFINNNITYLHNHIKLQKLGKIKIK